MIIKISNLYLIFVINNKTYKDFDREDREYIDYSKSSRVKKSKQVELSKEEIENLAKDLINKPVDYRNIFGYVSQENQLIVYNKYDKISNIFVSYIKDSNKIVRSKLYSIREFNIEKAINYFSEID